MDVGFVWDENKYQTSVKNMTRDSMKWCRRSMIRMDTKCLIRQDMKIAGFGLAKRMKIAC